MRVKKVLLFAAPAVVLLGLAAWLLTPSVRAWYLLRGLHAADEAARPGWAAAVGGLGECALEPLVTGLAEGHGDNCAAGLDALSRHDPAAWWSPPTPSSSLADSLRSAPPKGLRIAAMHSAPGDLVPVDPACAKAARRSRQVPQTPQCRSPPA